LARLARPTTLELHPEEVPPDWGFAAGAQVWANTWGDYTYLTEGYYRALDLEEKHAHVIPTTAECLDAYVVPIALQKAKRAGIAVPEAQIVTDRFLPPPLMAYPINPFSSRGELLSDRAAIEARRAGLTYTGKYAVLCQVLPEDFRIDSVRVVLGRTEASEHQDFCASLYRTFRIPLMLVRVIVSQGAPMLSAIEPLSYKALSTSERTLLEGAGLWHG
jgi:hypothetical protein